MTESPTVCSQKVLTNDRRPIADQTSRHTVSGSTPWEGHVISGLLRSHPDWSAGQLSLRGRVLGTRSLATAASTAGPGKPLEGVRRISRVMALVRGRLSATHMVSAPSACAVMLRRPRTVPRTSFQLARPGRAARGGPRLVGWGATHEPVVGRGDVPASASSPSPQRAPWHREGGVRSTDRHGKVARGVPGSLVGVVSSISKGFLWPRHTQPLSQSRPRYVPAPVGLACAAPRPRAPRGAT